MTAAFKATSVIGGAIDMQIRGYSLDDLTKLLGAAGIASYVVGYLVLSYSLSTFGFDPASPFRSRVLATGISTLVFLAVPVLIGICVASIPSRGLPYKSILLMRLIFVPICCGMVCDSPGFTGDLPFVSTHYDGLRNSRTLVLLIAALAGCALLIGTVVFAARWIWLNYHKRTLACTLLISVGSLGAILLENLLRDTPMRHRLFWWFIVIAWITCFSASPSRELALQEAHQKRIDECIRRIDNTARLVEDDSLQIEALRAENATLVVQLQKQQPLLEEVLLELRSETSAERLGVPLGLFQPILILSYCIFAVGIYSTSIFPLVPRRLGGGEAAQVTVYETEGTADRAVHCKLLDQNDEGFLVLPSGSEKGLFLQKARVHAIDYSGASNDLNVLLR